MIELQTIIEQVRFAAEHAATFGFIIIFLLMALESSFIPFPSEVIMIPAGFLAYRAEMTFGIPALDLSCVIFFGLIGSLFGAYINYYLALFLGRPFLYKYGNYFFIKPDMLKSSERIFRKYGDITIFICRLLPAIRQLISLPAGIARMSLTRFTFYTCLGAGIWSGILAWIGYYLGSFSKEMSYTVMIHKGEDLLSEHYMWLFLSLLLIISIYILVHIRLNKFLKNKF